MIAKRYLCGTFLVVLVMLLVCQVARAGAEDLLESASWVYSTDGGKTYTAEIPSIASGKTVKILAKIVFDVHALPNGKWLTLENALVRGSNPLFTLNGKDIDSPLKGVRYQTLPAFDAKMLCIGKNTLTASITIRNSYRAKKPKKDAKVIERPALAVKLSPKLLLLGEDELKFTYGPIISVSGQDSFTVTCGTNLPASVTLTAGKLTSEATEAGLYHRIRISAPAPAGKFSYQLAAKVGKTTIVSAKTEISLLDYAATKKMKLIVIGDSRSNPTAFSNVVQAVLKQKSDLVVHTGDMVADGRCNWHWPEQFYAPASELLATVPFYSVIGNHEQRSEIYFESLYSPPGIKGKDGRDVIWSQRAGMVLLIGIDSSASFIKGGDGYAWLEKKLKTTDASFVFVFSHYPAWSSSMHGSVTADGQAKEGTFDRGRKYIVPLLAKYKASAFIVGHDHCYERSLLPGGVTQLISGGAGASVRPQAKDANKRNPHCKLYIKKHHYLSIDIDGDKCEIKAITPAGKVLDTISCKAR